MQFVIKLFPEIIMKSRPVRKRMIQQLQSNMQNLLRALDTGIQVKGGWDKLEVSLDEKNPELRLAIIQRLKQTPGIAYFLETEEYPLGSFEEISQLVVDAYRERVKDKTFKVRVRRAGQHDFQSPDLARYVGGAILEHAEPAGVNVKTPEVFVDLEVKHQQLFIVKDTFPGLGGYPLGSQHDVLSLISGGFDSVVASYMTMRRGSKTHFLFFNLGGAAHELGVKQVALYLWQQFGASAGVKFISLPFAEVVGEILQTVHHSHMGVVLKRMMMRAGEQVANRFGIEALVTGESLAQVSSQTLPNLNLIDVATKKLVIRPLIVMDKQDIIDLSRKIGAYDFAKAIPEYCGVISDRPTTHAKQERLEAEEENFDNEVLVKAIANMKVISIHEIVVDAQANAKVKALSSVDKNQIVIDIRAPHEQEKKPLNLPNADILTIPFYKLEAELPNLDSSKQYLLYCEQGVMSQMQAQQLQEQGRKNIQVLRLELN